MRFFLLVLCSVVAAKTVPVTVNTLDDSLHEALASTKHNINHKVRREASLPKENPEYLLEIQHEALESTKHNINHKVRREVSLPEKDLLEVQPKAIQSATQKINHKVRRDVFLGENRPGDLLEVQHKALESFDHHINHKVRREAPSPENGEDILEIQYKAVHSGGHHLHQNVRREVFSTEAPEIISFYDEESPVSRVTIISENGVSLKRPIVYQNTAFEYAADGSAKRVHKQKDEAEVDDAGDNGDDDKDILETTATPVPDSINKNGSADDTDSFSRLSESIPMDHESME